MARPKKTQLATTISVRGDKEFRMKVAILAARRGCDVADVTRAALDAIYGAELASIDIFFVENDANLHQMMKENNEGGAA